MSQLMSRRSILFSAAASAALAGLPRNLAAAPMPEVRAPRSTSGDQRFEPDWEERLTVTVGPDKADIAGSTDRAIQAAVDYVARLGGGTVQILPGRYTLRNSIFMKAGVRMLGSGPDSLLFKKENSETTLADNSDWYDQEITLVNPDGFQVGDGIILETKNSEQPLAATKLLLTGGSH